MANWLVGQHMRNRPPVAVAGGGLLSQQPTAAPTAPTSAGPWANPWFHMGLGILGANFGHRGAAEVIGKGGLLGLNSYRQAKQMAAQQQAQQMQHQQRLLQMQVASAQRAQEEKRRQALQQYFQGVGGPIGQLGMVAPEAAVKARLSQLKPEEATSLQKNLVAAGLQPGTEAFQKAMLEATTKPASTTNVYAGQPAPSPGTKEMYKQAGEAINTRIGEYQERARLAAKSQAALNRFQMGLDQLGKTGKHQQLAKALRELGQVAGLPIDEKKLADAQSVDMAAKQMVADQLRLNKGPQTDFDAQFTGEYLPGLGTATEANRQGLRYLASINRLDRIYGRGAVRARRFEGNKPPDFGMVQQRLDRIDQASSNTPAVIKVPSGAGSTWVMFEDFYNIKRKKGVKDQEIVDAWVREAQKVSP